MIEELDLFGDDRDNELVEIGVKKLDSAWPKCVTVVLWGCEEGLPSGVRTF